MGETSAEQSAVEVAVELLAHEGGERDREGPVIDRPVEGLPIPVSSFNAAVWL